MGEVILDALIDTLKILPILLVMNLLIELLEHCSGGLKANRLLKGGFAPLIGTAVGVLPQCGFSVVATELYSKRRIALGTLLAVYLVTSDEALPIMLSSYDGVVKLLPLLIIKIVFALVAGYAVFGIEAVVARKKGKKRHIDECEHAHASENTDENAMHEHMHGDEHDEEEVPAHIHGCHRHALEAEAPAEIETRKQKAARIWRQYFEHPLLHTATVLFFILAVNVVFGTAVYFVGEDRLAAFIGSTGYFQPLLAAVVGLIPNCAGSVVITELYVVGGLDLGGAVAGLCMSAGIGYAVLIKQNRPVRNTVAVIAVMFVLSVAVGTAVSGVATAIGYAP